MTLPVVGIIGRPNVGKSSLFNALAGKRIAIVDPTAGTTRDRLTTPIQAEKVWVELMDTGGVGVVDADALSEHIQRQIELAMEIADLIVFVVDAQEGLVPLDRLVAERLRPLNKPVLLVANKADNAALAAQTSVMATLGFKEPLPLSAKTGHNKAALLARIAEELDKMGLAGAPPSSAEVKIAVVGKRNAGKSAFLNAVVGQPRVIVSEVPGTTRDSVDVRFEKDGRPLVIIDTAGVRKKKSLKGDLEFYSFHRAQRSIRRSDVTLFLIDSTVPVSEPDKKLADYIAQEYKPVVLVVNKWDLTEGAANPSAYRKYLDETLTMLRHAPLCFTTATEGYNVQEALGVALRLSEQSATRVTTGQLNRALERAIRLQSPPLLKKRKPPRIYFATQVGVKPVTIMLSVNDPGSFSQTYQRYLVRAFREVLPFSEVPIRLHLHGHHG